MKHQQLPMVEAEILTVHPVMQPGSVCTEQQRVRSRIVVLQDIKPT